MSLFRTFIDIPASGNEMQALDVQGETLRGMANLMDYPERIVFSSFLEKYRVDFIYPINRREELKRLKENAFIYLYVGKYTGRLLRCELIGDLSTGIYQLLEAKLRSRISELEEETRKMSHPARRLFYYQAVSKLYPLIEKGIKTLRKYEVESKS